MAATISTAGSQNLELTSSQLPPTITSPDQPTASSRSFIHLGSPRAQNTSFPVTPMSAVPPGLLDPPTTTSFADYLRTWTDAQVAKWLTEIKCPSHIDTFKEHDIRGDVLLELDPETLKEMNITSVGDKLRILGAGENRMFESPRDPPKLNGHYTSHSRENSRENTHQNNASVSRAPKRLENKPAPLVLSPQGRGDLPRLVREPSSGDSCRAITAVRPLPQPAQPAPANSHTSTRPSLPPLPPAPRGQPPQPPTIQHTGARPSPNPRNLHPLSVQRSRTPNQDLPPFTNSPLPPAPTGQSLLTPVSGSSSLSSFGLPSDPRSGLGSALKPPVRTPFSSQSSPRSANSATHGRNISFGGMSSPLGYAPLQSKQRPSTSGTHPYASAQPPPVQAISNQNALALSPIAESHNSGSSSPGSTSPPVGSFPVGRSPLSQPSHSHTPSLDERHKLVKFVLPEEGRSCVIDVADCAGGTEVMEKVLRKLENVGTRKNDPTNLTNRVETEDGKPLSEAELLTVCRGPPDPLKDQGLTLRRTAKARRNKSVGRDPDEERETEAQKFPSSSASSVSQTGQRAKAIKRASTISVLSGLGVRDPEKVLEPPASPTQSPTSSITPQTNSMKKPSKLRNFFGQRPPSELITTHLTEYFPFAEKKALRTARHSMMLRASVGGKRDSMMSVNHPLPSLSSIGTQGSGLSQRSASPARTTSSKGASMVSMASGVHDKVLNRSKESLTADEHPPRLSISTDDGRSVILTGDDVEKLSGSDSKPHLLPPVNFPTESLSESMENLTGSQHLSGASPGTTNRMSYMTELKGKHDWSDTASLLTVDEITAEVENRRQSMAVDMGVEGAEDWTKVESDIDEVSSLTSTTLDDEDEDEVECESEEETGKAVTCSGGTKWIKGALIGAGSFGKVYLGMDAVNGLLMAVKQVELPTGSAPNEERKKSMLSALEREIDLLKDLQHPNIVQYLYSSVDDDYLNIFLEYVPGGSVTALLRSYGAFEEPLVKNFVRQILQGLNYLHERDIIHRDIKGGNILVDNKGGIKISDFGISKKVDGNLLTGKRMYRPSFQGSVFWMAPEVVQQKVHTTAADIWSVGCLVVEMLTGEHPWAQLTQTQAIFKIGQSAKPEIPCDISSEAEDFLRKTFEIDHRARPSAGGLLQHAWLGAKKSANSSNKNIAASKNVPTIEVTT
ncbi:Pkinase-domain-containing protein [Pisolithus orientalis]|uniref:Pkinase-domain-containing protein n=1 Tax=Pisolithus orientalis TaxID=936130 RepID=UPI0022258597|nr:Pkinase-domain-containing protein [Pisolithus orientalis]KAI6028744.1 Pkinase-domain-containing protein [Pisolithus orientalis]